MNAWYHVGLVNDDIKFQKWRNMGYFQDMGLLFVYSLVILAWKDPNIALVFTILCTLILVCGIYFIQRKYVKITLCAVFGLTAIVVPEMVLFYPVLIYVLIKEIGWQAGLIISIVGAGFLVNHGDMQTEIIVKFVFGCLMAEILERKTEKYNKTDIELRKTVDAGEEKALLLSEKNRALMEKQNSEIYAATLRERNRIAREIHDNVGHVLSRTILLTGAARTVNKDQNLDNLLKGLDESLNSAMDSIRSSVHDLHDDAVNLQKTIENIIWDFKGNDVELEYDMSEIIPRDIKYCFISITKEALSNAAKYSGATQIRIIMREHPAMYQLCIEDNGKGCPDYAENSTGMGLKNMQERVEALGGTLRIDGDDGFRIFISVRKAS